MSAIKNLTNNYNYRLLLGACNKLKMAIIFYPLHIAGWSQVREPLAQPINPESVRQLNASEPLPVYYSLVVAIFTQYVDLSLVENSFTQWIKRTLSFPAHRWKRPQLVGMEDRYRRHDGVSWPSRRGLQSR